MKYSSKSRIIALIMIVCVLLPGFSFSFTAAESAAVQQPTTNQISDPTIDSARALLESDANDQAELVSEDCQIMQYVDEAAFYQANHVARLTEEEALNTYVFANQDGTRSVYYMDENVKFIDSSGAVKEKDITLVAKSDGYGVVQNEVGLLLPNEPESGIDVSYGGYSVKLTPQGGSSNVSALKVDNSIVYKSYFGAHTLLRYTPILSGVKEEVVLTAYTDNASYDFMLETDGLNLYNSVDGYYLASTADSEAVFCLGDIFVYDAIGRPCEGTMNVTAIEAGKKYRLTVSVDDAYLSDPLTVYPVTIDPTITLSDNVSTNSIQDCPIFSGRPNLNHGNYAYNHAGYVDSTYGTGRTAVRLSGLINSAVYKDIGANDITKVEFYVKDSSGGSSKSVQLVAITGNSTWTEWGLTWADLANTSLSYQCNASVGNSQWTAFNITSLVKAWKNGTYLSSLGFLLLGMNESLVSNFFASEAATTANRPYVVMTYNPFVHIELPTSSSNSELEIVIGETITLTARTYPETVDVEWQSTYPSIATVDEGVVIGKEIGTTTISAGFYDANGVLRTAECTVHVRLQDGTYYIQNKQNGYYADIKDQVMASGTTIYQWEHQTRKTQKWVFTHIGDGYYSIKSANATTPYYMGVKNDSTGTMVDIVLRTGSLTNGMKWKIETTASGTYKLIPETGEANDYVLATTTSNAENGAKLVQDDYAANTSYRDEWKIEFAGFTIVHYYDSTFLGNQELINDITRAQLFVEKVYKEELDVEIRMKGVPIYFPNTYADQCLRGTNVPCTNQNCGTSCLDHHKNVENNWEQIYYAPREKNHIYVMWSNRPNTTFCWDTYGQHTLVEWSACVMHSGPVVQVLTVDNSSSRTRVANMATVFAHELAHTFDLDDIGDAAHTDKDGDCVMGNLNASQATVMYEAIMKPDSDTDVDAFCTPCTKALSTLALSRIHEGN